MFSEPKKIILAITLVSFISSGLFFAFPRPAKAQAPIPIPVADAPLLAIQVQKELKQNLGQIIVQGGTIALVNAMNYFVQKLAYDTASWIASAGPGQKPLFDGRSFGDYVSDISRSAAMKFITEINDASGLKNFGFDVCAPTNLSIIFKIKIGFLQGQGIGFLQGQGRFQQPEEPRCEWKQMVDNWEAFGQSFATGAVLKNFGVMFEPGQSDLGLALEFNSKVLASYETERENASAERQASGGWQGVKDFISGKVTTPENVVREQFGKAMLDNPQVVSKEAWSGFGRALSAGAWQIIPAALSNFTNTLLNKAFDRLASGFFSPYDLHDENNSINLGDAGASNPAVGRRKAQEIYSEFIKPKIISGSNYDPLIEFSICPSSEEDKQINNCVLDDQFAAAIRQADQGKPLTIKEAIDQGFLDGLKPLISSQDMRNEQMDCYQKGYCFSNLVKLRKARILPVGFELSAELANVGTVAALEGSGAVTSNLQTVMDGFYKCGKDAKGNDVRDGQHPFCHLIDPNWILRLPKTQCQAQVYGPTLVSSAGNLRSQVCADPVTCISEDEKGNCIGGWGYCTKEKNIWKIPADKCSEQFNSCLTYKGRDNKAANYLKNTVDFASCNEQTAGCRNYSISQSQGVWSGSSDKQIFFNKNLEKCDAKDAGCSEVYSKAEGLKYNLLPNPSFENFSGLSIVGWTGEHDTATNDFNLIDGKTAAKVFIAELAAVASIKLELNTPYTVSAYAKSGVGGTFTAVVGARLFTDSAATKLFEAANIVSTCKNIEANVLSVSTVAPSDAYTRLSCSFLSPSQVLYAKVFLSTVGSDVVWYDAAQLEEGSSATTFLASGYGAVESANIKIAPDYLDCQAGGTNPECSSYAPSCRADEVGCQSYSPKNNDPPISGVATVNDICWESCAGYETYKQDATLYDDSKFPNYFIPSTAKVCPAQDVGCDEFTNLATEAKEYFSFVRQCIKPDSNFDAVFYTWEGSDTTGYQLKSHKLKFEIGTLDNPAPEYIKNTDPQACTKAIFIAPLGDPNYNPDCREFYNAKGNVFYRLLSRTIISTDGCAEYRKTDSNQFNCEKSGGNWNAAAQYCVYKGFKAESQSCGAASNGCRAYSGAASNNLRFVFQDDFEARVGGWSGGEVSSEALSAGGHSYKKISRGKSEFIFKNLSGSISPLETYIVSFWAKAPSGGELTIDFANTGAVFAAGGNIADLKGDWRFYELGPFNLSATIANASLNMSLAGSGGFYIDNIILKEVSKKLYLVKNSWKTPSECDATLSGLFLPQAMLGCKEYTDKNKEKAYLKSFASLCRPEAVGCSAFQNTYNSKSDKNEIHNVICSLSNTVGGECQYNGATVCSVGPNNSICRFKITDGVLPAKVYWQEDYKDYESFQAKLRSETPSGGYLIARDESTILVPQDKTIYIVDDKQYHCQSKDLACSALGQGELYTGNQLITVYYKNQPENYSSLLCGAESVGCESFTSAKGVDYFKSPQTICEYRDGGKGWFKQGTDTPCYGGLIQNGVYGIWRNADAGYGGSVGACPANQNLCAEFVDPLDTSAKNKTGKPYYIIDNEKLKALENDQSCGNKGSLEEGCVLFNKTSDVALKFNAGATYLKARQEKTAVTPVDKGYCQYQENIGTIFEPKYGYRADSNKVCLEDIDCLALSGTAVSAGNFIVGAGATYTGKCVVSKDANTILKVTRDRECGEWLACKSSYKAYDPITNKARAVCAEIELCDKYQTAGVAACANFIAASPDSNNVLSADYYSKRNVSWNGADYSGYSIGNHFSVADIETIDADSSPDKKDLRLYVLAKTSLSGGGSVIEKNIDGAPFNKNQAEKTTCRGYPEQDSPFPASIGEWDINKRLQAITIQGLKNATICEYGKNCDCDYTKLTYGSQANKKYVNYGERSVPLGICQGGSYEGLECKPGATYTDDPQNSCGKPEEGGNCLKLLRQDDVIGWQGYCLERDLSTPINGGKGDKNQKACITWLPQDIVPGSRDIYNQFRTAGYIPPIGGGKYYCLQAEGNYSHQYYGVIGYWPSLINSGYDVFLVDVSALLQFNPKYSLSEYFYRIGEIYTIDILGDNLSGYKTSWNPRGIFYDLGNVSAKRPIYKDTIDLIKIRIGKVNAPFLQSSIPENAVFYIRADQKSTKYMSSTGKCNATKTNNCSGEGEGAGTLTGSEQAKSLKEGNAWYFRYNDGQGNNSIDFLGSDLTSSDTESVCIKQANDFQTGFQFKFTFDKDTGVLTTVSYIGCDANATLEQPASFSASFSVSLRETCSVVADMAAFKNQAYTDRIWAYNANNLKGKEVQPAIKESLGTVVLPYHYNYEIQPFGSAAADTAPSQLPWYSYYAIGTPNFAGVPWSCKKNCGTPGVVDEKTGKTGSDNDLNTVDFQPSIGSAILLEAGKSDSMKGKNYLSKLFSKIFNIFQLDNNRTYQQNICDAASSNIYCDLPNDKVDIVKYPKVFAFNPNKKLSNGQYQLADENRVLVNNQLSNINISGNQYSANLRFYFWADTDHMPIRSIKVDWGDGSTVETTDGLYKNHKPLCAKNNTDAVDVCSGAHGGHNFVCSAESGCPVNKYINLVSGGIDAGSIVSQLSENQTCSAKNTLFGNAPEACDESYFEFQHTYICSSGSIGYDSNTNTCSFTPKVIITDNWGIDNTFDGAMIKNNSDLKNKAGFLGPATGPTIKLIL